MRPFIFLPREFALIALDKWDEGTDYRFFVVLQETGEMIGVCGVVHVDGTGPDVELVYEFQRSAWGQGYGTEASRALICKGFTELGVRRVVASTYADNLASRRVMEKAGLTLVRTYRLTPGMRSAIGP